MITKIIQVSILFFIFSEVLLVPIDTEEYIKPEIKVLEYKNQQSQDGYHLYYKLSDGQYRNDTIEILNSGTDMEEVNHKGEYGFTGSDGYLYKITYYADKTGYHANVQRFVQQSYYTLPIVLKSLVG